MNSKIPQTPDDLRAQLREQIQFIETSALAFDNGSDIEAKRLAVPIQVLVHDRGSSKSLLGQLGLKDTLQFWDSAGEPDAQSIATFGGLVALAIGPASTRFVAMLDNLPPGRTRRLPFREWWDRPVFIDDQRRKLSRRELINSARNEDGGGHVAANLEPRYHDLSRRNSMGWYAGVGDQPLRPLNGPERAAIRQISHEVLKTLVDGYEKMPNHEAEVAAIGMGLKSGAPGSFDPISQDAFSAGSVGAKVGRNEPCPCGSRKRFKHCHGQL